MPSPLIGRPRAGRALAVLAWLGLAVPVLAGCETAPDLQPRATMGAYPTSAIVALEPAVSGPVMASIQAFVAHQHYQVVSAQGTPEQIATSIKHGGWVDLAVMPPGPDLERLRGELVVPPVPLGSLGGTAYFGLPVTGRGLVVAQYLISPAGQAVLRRSGLGVVASSA